MSAVATPNMAEGTPGYQPPEWFGPDSKTDPEMAGPGTCRACGHVAHGGRCGYASHDGLTGVIVCPCLEVRP